ncbi:MAG: hypothetical protein J5849_05920 [Clostridia bacterium]|nr:hypothetical protein [Clostridia bacterium]
MANYSRGPKNTLLITLQLTYEAAGENTLITSTRKPLLIYDPVRGKTIRQIWIPYNSYVCDHVYDDGTFAVVDTGEDGVRYVFYDITGEIRSSLKLDDGDFCYISSDKRFAYYAARELYRKDLYSGEIETVPLPGGMEISYIQNMLPDSDRLYLQLLRSPTGHEQCTALFDPDQGDFLILTDEYLFRDGPTERSVYALYDGEAKKLFFERDGVYREFTDLPPSYEYSEASVDGGWYLFRLMNEDLLVYSPEDNAYALFPEKDLVSNILYFPEVDSFFCVVKNGSGNLIPMLVRRDCLDFAESQNPLREPTVTFLDLSIVDAYARAAAEAKLSNSLDACRTRADRMEEAFGFEILLSDECSILAQNGGFLVHSSSEWDEDREIDAIRTALDEMENLFSVYPDDFFQHFKKGKDNGLVFMLTGPIESTYNVIAYERYDYSYCRYEIVFDMTYNYDLKCTLIHELWHAIEDSTEDFPYEEWDAIAPEGFSYQGQYENAEPIEGWTLSNADPDDVYFVDEYSKTFAKEDRARIIEYFFGREYLRSDLLSSKHLVEKYQILIEHIRRTMATDSWPAKLPWEVLP